MELAEQFVDELRKRIVDGNLEAYLNVLQSRQPSEFKDPHWQQFMKWVQDSGDLGRQVVETVFRQILCDAVANVLAVIDGSSVLPSMRGDIKLTYDGNEIQDTLSDNFWEQEEQGESM